MAESRIPNVRRIAGAIGRGLIDDPWYKLLAFVIALGTFVWVQSQETATAFLRIGMEYRLPEDLVNVEPLPGGVTLVVQGTRTAIRRAQAASPKIHVDLAELAEGPGPIDLRLDEQVMDDLPGLDKLGFNPDLVTVRLDERMRKNVAVSARWVGRPAQHHEVRGATTTPDVVELFGPRVFIESIDVVPTLPIDVTGWTEKKTVPAKLDLPRGVDTVADWKGAAVVNVVSVRSSRTLPSVAVVVPGAPDWAPAEDALTVAVELEGPTDLLRDLRAGDILARVTLPADPKGDRYEARFEADKPPRLDVVVPRRDQIEIVNVPGPVVVERR